MLFSHSSRCQIAKVPVPAGTVSRSGMQSSSSSGAAARASVPAAGKVSDSGMHGSRAAADRARVPVQGAAEAKTPPVEGSSKSFSYGSGKKTITVLVQAGAWHTTVECILHQKHSVAADLKTRVAPQESQRGPKPKAVRSGSSCVRHQGGTREEIEEA